jgi:hypothetical protein
LVWFLHSDSPFSRERKLALSLSRLRAGVATFYDLQGIPEQRRADNEGNTFTLYVDDLTLSGDHVNLRSLCAITKTFLSVGLKCHKTRSFEKNSPKLVTGVIVADDGLRLPNRRHLKIAEGMAALGTTSDLDERLDISLKLWGQINEAACIDARYKRRRGGLKKLVGRLVQATEQLPSLKTSA